MLSNTVYRLVSFADYSNLNYSKDKVDLLSDVFQKEGYSIMPTQEFGPQGELVFQGINLLPNGDKPIIIIGSQRIDVIKGSNKREGFDESDKKQLKLEVVNCILKIYSVFSSMIQDSNRLGWISEYAYFDISEMDMYEFRSRFLKEFDCFKNSFTTEFSAKYAGVEQHKIGKCMEKLNVVSTIRRWFPGQGVGFVASVDGFGIEIDINTVVSNKKNRFFGDSYGQFIEIADSIQRRIKGEMLYENK